MDQNTLIRSHGAYRTLKTFQLARLIYDLTVRFCDKYVSRFSRTRDQMIQAARSGVQNIAEGSVASATSSKTEIKLTNVARASLEELICDYEDFLRQEDFAVWGLDDPRRKIIIAHRFQTADALAKWINAEHQNTGVPTKELAANAMLTLLSITCMLLKRQINAQAKAFEEHGGFTERLYHTRQSARRNGQ